MEWKDIVGKTIKKVDDKSTINVVFLEFTDGTGVALETERVFEGLYRPTVFDKFDYMSHDVCEVS